MGSNYKMPSKNWKQYRRLAFVAGVVLLLDQLSKFIIIQYVPLYHQIQVIPGIFNITHILNPGGAFGFLANSNYLLRYALFVGATVLAIGLIVYFYRSVPPTHPWLATALALICGGAIGNLIDRLRWGKVVDFLDFYLQQWHWPAFNVADSAISVGMVIFVYHLVFNKMPPS
jgi:signal peptidase II